MKYISQFSNRLTQAFKRIEELEKENIKLRKENVTLRTLKPRPSKTGSMKSPSPKGNHHYAQPTASSRNKVKSKPQEAENPNPKSPTFTGRDGATYIYKDCVPIMITPEDDYGWPSSPRYMHSTCSSSEREAKGWVRGWPPLLPTLKKEINSPPTPPPSPPLSASTTLIEVENKPEDDLAERSRLGDDLKLGIHILTDSKTNLDYLRKAAEIAQKSIFDVGKIGGLGRWRAGYSDVFKDGPHLIRLGRDELMSWLGEFPTSELRYNGHPDWKVYLSLLGLVPLRNTISHPSAYELQDSGRTDRLLKSAQEVSVILGDEKGALEIRAMRDALLRDAHNAWQSIKDLYYLSLLPSEERLDFKYHQVNLFEYALLYSDRWDEVERDLYKEVLAVASAWDSKGE
ncbi:hypothetical protein E0Z10_g10250 [Xylaria hypoxylon]|uniref:Uncharacterized protein n=1 Tax=Xylaria hypoxylon TaxID=37992 RepID=A0A4Z0YF41_9PEZI|nr:hypothetical protein E0Z10_g10250 [Xylaria hypoxylon]